MSASTRSGTFGGHRVVVAGIGLSGRAAARALLQRGAAVVVVDEREEAAVEDAAEELRSMGAELRLGTTDPRPDGDLVVTSPGWRPNQPLLAAAAAAGVEVVGEPELAWRLRPAGAAPWLGVTGTNGKTTTVGMLAAILTAAGRRTVAAGNVGVPLTDVVLAEPAYDVVAVELSSFQLHWSRDLRCAAAAVLNVAEDHLDWHGTMDEYAAAKGRILRGGATAVYNRDDPWSVRLAAASSHRVGFGLDEPAPGDVGVSGGRLVEGAGAVLAAVDDVGPVGPHNLANALAAAALARTAGVAPEAVATGLRATAPGGHRNQLVAAGGGVSWVDDSKATNPHAAAASLAAYRSVVWIAGGLLKGADVADLVSSQAHRLRAVVLIGRDRGPFRAALARHAPDVPVSEVASSDTEGMDDAVRLAAAAAAPGDTVLLAPAAASWDMFRDYAERGDRFAAAARAVTGAG